MTLPKQYFREIFLYSVLIISAQHCAYSYADEVTQVVVDEVAKVGFKAIIEKATEALPYLKVAHEIRKIAQEIQCHQFPTDENKKYAIAVVQEYGLLAAEDALEKCLIKHKDALERSRSGLPSACDEIVYALHEFGGGEEVSRMTAIYNQYRK